RHHGADDGGRPGAAGPGHGHVEPGVPRHPAAGQPARRGSGVGRRAADGGGGPHPPGAGRRGGHGGAAAAGAPAPGDRHRPPPAGGTAAGRDARTRRPRVGFLERPTPGHARPERRCPMAEESVVLTEARGPVLVITINRPEARNSMNKAAAEAMGAALDRLDAEPDLSVGVITGAGKGFSAGMDLKGFAAGEFPVAGDRGFAGIAQRSARKPLIAAIEGFALAGGLEIALACDVIVASREAKLGIPEVGVGLFAGAGALLRLPRRVGQGQAALLALTGKPISDEEGGRIGLVDRVVDPGSALDEALALAQTIAANAPL